jgi:hypothetical protein
MYRTNLALTCAFSFDFVPPPEPVDDDGDAGAAAAVRDEANHDDECVVCMDEKPVMRNEGCTHAVMCIACAFKFVDGHGVACPKCRAPITKLYLETGNGPRSVVDADGDDPKAKKSKVG